MAGSSRNARPSPPRPTALPRRDPQSTEVTRHLVDYLLSGALEAGQRLPGERELAEALNVGRSGVREAIKSLSLLGLLDVRHGSGTYLSNSPSDLLPRVIEWGLLLNAPRVYDLMEARTHLEIDVAVLAAQRRDAESVARLSEVLEQMRVADTDIEAYVDADIEFHLTIAAASGNEVMANLVRSIQSLLRVWATRVLQAAGETATSFDMHAPILDAIERQDPDAAREAMSAHMERATKRLRATLDTEQATAT